MTKNIETLQAEISKKDAQIKHLEETLVTIHKNTAPIDFLPEHDKMYFALKAIRHLSSKTLRIGD